MSEQQPTLYCLFDLDDTIGDNKRFSIVSLIENQTHLRISPHIDHIPLFEGVKDHLQLLKSHGVKTGIVSNSTQGWVTQSVNRHKLTDLVQAYTGRDVFDSIETDPEKCFNYWGGRLDGYKPSPATMVYTLEKLGVEFKPGMPPIQVTMTGDSLECDMGAAYVLNRILKYYNPESSCIRILFNSQKYSYNNLKETGYNYVTKKSDRPDYVVSSYEGLTGLVRELFQLQEKETLKEEKQNIRPAYLNAILQKANIEQIIGGQSR